MNKALHNQPFVNVRPNSKINNRDVNHSIKQNITNTNKITNKLNVNTVHDIANQRNV